MNPNNPQYPNYGGRGIRMCERWSASFETFLADVGNRPSPLYSIDRYPNNDGDYEPGNVRWATIREQLNNTRTCQRVTFRGEVITVPELARRAGLHVNTLKSRINTNGLTPEQAVTMPKHTRSRTFME